MKRIALLLAVVVAVGAACSSSKTNDTAGTNAATTTVATTPATTARVADSTVWLCKPGMADNPCDADQTATEVGADGSHTIIKPKAAATPAFDCFYVYPTVSMQKGAYADLTIDAAQIDVAKAQASPFSATCRVFAPMYRQRTLAGIFNTKATGTDADAQHAYDDVAAAWKTYLANENNGRGVVLIGHSQGTMVLTKLIQNEIDAVPAERRRLISALLIGGNVTVAKGKNVGGSFQHLPLCDAPTATGCVVAYSTFGSAPEASSFFGLTRDDTTAACTNPADLGGGEATLHPAFPVGPSLLGGIGLQPSDFTTPWVRYPNYLRATCKSNATHTWLQIDTNRVANDPRAELVSVLPGWGLHTLDMNVASQDLVSLVRAQANAWKH